LGTNNSYLFQKISKGVTSFNNQSMRDLLLALLISWSTLLTAQAEVTTPYTKSPVFAQVGFGTLRLSNFEFSAAVGYRFSPHIGLGVEYRSTYTSSVSVGKNARLMGLHLRGQLRHGWIASLGGGFDQYAYRSGGYYLASDLGYQFRWGLTIGLYATSVQGQTYDVSLYNFDNDTYEPTGGTYTEGLLNLGLKVGYAFPGRDKRR